MKYTVLLKTNTVGHLTAEHVAEGDIVTVNLRDENGNPIQERGEVAEILEAHPY